MSASPISPRPRLPNRSSSNFTASLSSSAANGSKPATNRQRPHLVRAHSRTASARNMGPKKSMTTVYGDGGGRQHRRVKSGTTTPIISPRSQTSGGGQAHMKRNASHAVLPKNRSHGNLRKNQSTNTLTALNRNLSRGALNKLGAPVGQKRRKVEEEQQKQGVFDLGNASGDEDEEAEWEDSTASPELTRNNSKVSTPQRAHTPNGESKEQPPEPAPDLAPEKSSSPPSPVVLKNNKSAPNLRSERISSDDRLRQQPALLQQQNGRGTRAPPAMITTHATSSQQHLARNESQRSLLKSANTSLEASQEGNKPVTTPTFANQSSSGSGAVSHFLTNEQTRPRSTQDDSDSDSDSQSVSDFMASYKPQPSESPEKPRVSVNKPRVASQPSRTQQKLELQRRRQAMQGAGSSAPLAMGFSAGSSASLHSRTHSHGKGPGRTKTVVGDTKTLQRDYETAVKQLTVVRRFRNPVLESLERIRQAGNVPAKTSNIPSQSKMTTGSSKRPPSRHGNRLTDLQTTETNQNTTRKPLFDSQSSTTTVDCSQRGSKVSFAGPASAQSRQSGGRDSRVTFQLSRQNSHEDMLTSSRGSPDAGIDDDSEGVSPGEALIRRMWESRIHVS